MYVYYKQNNISHTVIACTGNTSPTTMYYNLYYCKCPKVINTYNTIHSSKMKQWALSVMTSQNKNGHHMGGTLKFSGKCAYGKKCWIGYNLLEKEYMAV